MMLDGCRGDPELDENREAGLGSPTHSPGAIGFAAFLRFPLPGFVAVQKKIFPTSQAFVAWQFLVLDPGVPFAVANVTNHFSPPDNDPLPP
jgi:hypothetical protein